MGSCCSSTSAAAGGPGVTVKPKSTANDDKAKKEVAKKIIADPEVGKWLKQVPLFLKLSRDRREKVGGGMVPKSFKKGETVFAQGDPGLGFYVIKTGSVTVTVNQPDGADDLELATLKKGDYFGETALIQDGAEGKRGANVIAVRRFVYFSHSHSIVAAGVLIDCVISHCILLSPAVITYFLHNARAPATCLCVYASSE